MLKPFPFETINAATEKFKSAADDTDLSEDEKVKLYDLAIGVGRASFGEGIKRWGQDKGIIDKNGCLIIED